MGRTKNTKANNSALDKTPTNLPNSQETGHSSEPEKTRPTTTPTPTTPVSTAGIHEELKSGDVASVLTGATETQRSPDTLKSKPPFAMAGNQDALQLSGITPVFEVVMHERGGWGELSAGVSHAAGQLLTQTHNDDLTGVTTTPEGQAIR